MWLSKLMANLFKTILSLFGTKSDSAETEPSQQLVEPVIYKDFLIYVIPRLEGGQYRVAGVIEKPAGSAEKEVQRHQFIRSDLCMHQQQAEQITLRKCKLLIDQVGDDMFV